MMIINIHDDYLAASSVDHDQTGYNERWLMDLCFLSELDYVMLS